MKILHILDSLNRGGAEMLALDVCRNARANDLDLIFAATGGGDLEADFENSGVEFFRLQRRLPLDFPVVRNLRKIIRENAVDVVHAHQAVEGLHAYLACRGTKAKLVLSFHGYIPNAKNRLALKFLIPRAAANIAVSREFLQRLGREENFDIARNFYVVHNGVDAKRLRGSGENLRTELNLPDDALLAGMIGNFTRAPLKDQLTVCRALPEFFRRAPRTFFVFVGSAAENSDYEKCLRFCAEQKISDRVFFLGKRTDIGDVLNALDIFVLSSRQESFGIAPVEAMLAKVPAVLSGIAPFLEISRGGECVRIFPPGDAALLTGALARLAADENERSLLAEKAFTFAENNFSIEVHLRELKKLYAKILSE